MSKNLNAKAILLLALFIAVDAQAGEEPDTQAIPPKTHAIQVSPLGLLLGTYALDYEILLRQRHGFCVDLLYANGRDLSGSKLEGKGFSISYRYHLKGRMNSNFLGIFLRKGEIDGEIKEDDERFPYHFDSLSFGPLYGERHIWKNNMSFSWKLGYGYPLFDFKWRSARRPAHPGLIRGILKWTTNIESGVSFGYTF